MEDIIQPLYYLFAWYDSVQKEHQEAQEHIKALTNENSRLTDSASEYYHCFKEREHSLKLAQARIRVLEGELQDKEDNFKFLQGLIEDRLKKELDIEGKLALMRAQIRTLEQERDEALVELDMWRNRYYEVS